MLKPLIAIITALAVFILIFLTFYALKGGRQIHYIKSKGEIRVISLIPSVTETLFFIGAGGSVKGRTRYCAYPPEVRQIPELGGLFDINYEGIISLSPDIVILSELQRDAAARLKTLGINYLTVNHNDFNGVLQSFSLIGEAVGKDTTDIVDALNDRIAAIRQRAAAYPPKKVVVAVSREAGRFIIAGGDGFYSEALKILNVENPFADSAPYTAISREALLRLKPDLLIALSYYEQTDDDKDGACIVSGSFGYTPGPRFPLLLESFARCIYPEKN
ncbi:MAG: helical backbone metal receptor [Deferribacteraceae bacterium]|jgi:iron complex transport system substrate-binding protein|nr:helical backbone metal receptor [Deferribacteraceae bacterium]